MMNMKPLGENNTICENDTHLSPQEEYVVCLSAHTPEKYIQRADERRSVGLLPAIFSREIQTTVTLWVDKQVLQPLEMLHDNRKFEKLSRGCQKDAVLDGMYWTSAEG